uniref:Trehalase n=1 Tax=Cyprinus carpio TaxID=7962 RepID=A0A8C2F576_CYPCA
MPGLFVATSQIYCTGEVLQQVQMAKLFDDDKFFSGFPNKTVPSSELQKIIQTYFEEPVLHWQKPLFLSFSHIFLFFQKNVIIKVFLFFRESYWVMNGLHLSEMTETAQGMILNFVYLVKRYGFVPNGGWVYYEQRSQPPLLPLMVESFYEVTRDRDFLRQVLPAVETEYSFWMQNCSFAVSMSGLTHILNQYNVPVRQLINTVCFKNIKKLWIELTSGAESGWDFSSCWYIYRQHSPILPADLNAIMCRSEHLLASFHRILVVYILLKKRLFSSLRDNNKAAEFEQCGFCHLSFYPSNMALLWAQCYSKLKMADQGYADSGGLDYPKGLPTSLSESGQQWDMPNALPPLQHMIIEGLSGLNSAHAKELAFSLAQRWIQTNHQI